VNNFIELSEIKKASQLLKGVVIESPFQKIKSYSKKYNSNIFFKREDLQNVRSFKIRGAFNKISSLTKSQSINGLVCASAGNHAQGFAVSCTNFGYKGRVYMPKSTPNQKIEKVRKFGKNNIEIILFGENFSQAYEMALKDCHDHNKIFIHPFDDIKVITGQATLFLEIIDQIDNELDYLFIPIGGGGLISGAINVFKQLSPQTKIIGIEPKGAPSMFQSLKKNRLVKLDKIDRFVDGIAVKKVGNYSFDFCKKYLDDIIILDENEICNSILELKDQENIIAEPAGAMSSASLWYYKEKIIGKNVGCIICGGNNDNSRMPEIIRRAKKWKTNNPNH
tara:strand:- start:818 stop:1825 length:1008 start_codon:yes stop_codon:yes gene_type:complete